MIKKFKSGKNNLVFSHKTPEPQVGTHGSYGLTNNKFWIGDENSFPIRLREKYKKIINNILGK